MTGAERARLDAATEAIAVQRERNDHLTARVVVLEASQAERDRGAKADRRWFAAAVCLPVMLAGFSFYNGARAKATTNTTVTASVPKGADEVPALRAEINSLRQTLADKVAPVTDQGESNETTEGNSQTRAGAGYGTSGGDPVGRAVGNGSEQHVGSTGGSGADSLPSVGRDVAGNSATAQVRVDDHGRVVWPVEVLSFTFHVPEIDSGWGPDGSALLSSIETTTLLGDVSTEKESPAVSDEENEGATPDETPDVNVEEAENVNVGQTSESEGSEGESDQRDPDTGDPDNG